MRWVVQAFETIADSLNQENGNAINKVCRQFIVLCIKAILSRGQLAAIDGTNFESVGILLCLPLRRMSSRLWCKRRKASLASLNRTLE